MDGIFAFVNATDIPVYKMLSVSSSLGNTSVADSMVGRYRDLIAAKYAEVYIRKAAVDLTAALTIYKSKSVGVTARASDDLLAKLPELEKKARDALLVAYSQSVSSFNIGQEVAFMEPCSRIAVFACVRKRPPLKDIYARY
jgi:conjugative transfer pilus assembly protein TraH